MADTDTKHSVLIVEDSATLRYMLGKTLQKEGHEVLSVSSFSSASDMLQATSH